MRFTWHKSLLGALLVLALFFNAGFAQASAQGQVFDAYGFALDDDLIARLGAGALTDEFTAAGYDVRLTLDAALQRVAEEALAEALNDPNFPYYGFGAVVVMDMEGRVLAMADNRAAGPAQGLPLALSMRSAPGRMFLPLTGLSSMAAGLLDPFEKISDEGDYNMFAVYDAPHCWIAPDQIGLHQDQTIVEALKNSCDYYFCTAAARMGNEPWYKLAHLYGLGNVSGLDIPGERRSLLPSQETLYNPELPADAQLTLYPIMARTALIQELRRLTERQEAESAEYTRLSEDALAQCAEELMRMMLEANQNHWVKNIRSTVQERLALPVETMQGLANVTPMYQALTLIKWSGADTLDAARGLSYAQVTPIAMARYWTTLANGGRLYAASLFDVARNPGGSFPEEPRNATLITDVSELVQPYLPYVHRGLQGIVDCTGESASVFTGWPYREDIASMAAVACTPKPYEGQGPDSWVAGFAPLKNPQISVVVWVPREESTEKAAKIFRAVTEQYLWEAGYQPTIR